MVIEENIIGEDGALKMNPNKLNSNAGGRFTEGWIPIKQIINGMIQLDSGEYVTGVKVAPKNIFIMDQESQDATIYNLRNLYNSIDFEFWLLIADRPVDIDVYVSRLQIAYNEAQSSAMQKLILQDINKANLFTSAEYNVVDTEYYLLFKEKRLEIVQKKLHNLMSGLAQAGMQSTQTSNNDLRMVLDNFLNDGEKTTFGTVM